MDQTLKDISAIMYKTEDGFECFLLLIKILGLRRRLGMSWRVFRKLLNNIIYYSAPALVLLACF
jgi:hypothetical protein